MNEKMGPAKVDEIAAEIRRLNNLDETALYVPSGSWDRIIYNGDFGMLVLPRGYYMSTSIENGKIVDSIMNRDSTGDATYWSFPVSSGVDEFVAAIRRRNPKLGYKDLKIKMGGWNWIIYNGDPNGLVLPNGFHWEANTDNGENVKCVTNSGNVQDSACCSFKVSYAVEEIVREIQKINLMKEETIRVKPGCWRTILYKGHPKCLKLPKGFKVEEFREECWWITNETNLFFYLERS